MRPQREFSPEEWGAFVRGAKHLKESASEHIEQAHKAYYQDKDPLSADFQMIQAQKDRKCYEQLKSLAREAWGQWEPANE